ncbi:hypothetical protein D9M72_374760 [compost metagenome]
MSAGRRDVGQPGLDVEQAVAALVTMTGHAAGVDELALEMVQVHLAWARSVCADHGRRPCMRRCAAQNSTRSG